MATPATIERLCAEFDSPPEHITAAAGLLEAGATPAYLARFQRYALGSLPEDRLHAIAERLHALNELDQRKAAILQQAEERGKKTAELETIVATSVDQDLIDDLYQSMRPRRRGPAMQMEEKGLLPLAMALQHRQLGDQSLQEVAAAYIAVDKGLPSPENVLEGALLILSERIASDPTTRARFRGELKHGILKARAVNPDTAGNEQSSRYKDLFDFAEPIHRIPAGRMLALRRAEREGIVALELALPDGRARQMLRELHGKDLADDAPLLEFFHLVYDHAAQQLQEWCGKDVRRRLKEKADREAVRTYARNLRSQLLAPPLGSKKVLALRTSSKAIWAVLLGEDAAVDEHKTLPTETDEQKQGAIAWLVELIKGKQPAAIALPHGRRQAGSERVVGELRTALGETPMPMVVPVDEAASTIFATSTAGKKAIPGVEVGVRTAISLGRRLQDPLLELARMDMRTLGIGQTLDDVHQGMLQRELAGTASSCLAQIGVDLNTVGQDLLELIPGLDGEKAKAIFDRRRSIGGFRSRAQLAEVPGLDAATVRNVQGFVRVLGGDEPLDATGVHPDDYAIARAAAEKRSCQPIDMLGQNLRDTPIDEMATDAWPRQRIIHVLQALMRGNADSRGELVATQNAGVNSLADLHADRELKGRIASLTEFGAFVDLGIGQDGLVHISQIPGARLRDPQQQLRVGEVVTVWVLNVDQDKQKIGLTMYMPRHLREGRRPTLGERMDQQQGRRQRPEGGPGGPGGERRDRGDRGQRGDRREPAGPPGRFAGASRIGKRQPPAEPGKEGGDRPRFGRDRDDSGYDDRGPRGRGPREQRVYTVEPAREAADHRTHKGEFTSLANLRALLSGGKKADAPADAPKSPDA